MCLSKFGSSGELFHHKKSNNRWHTEVKQEKWDFFHDAIACVANTYRHIVSSSGKTQWDKPFGGFRHHRRAADKVGHHQHNGQNGKGCE